MGSLIYSGILNVCQGDARANAHSVKDAIFLLEEPGWRVELDYLSRVNHTDSVVSNDCLQTVGDA